MFQCIVQNGWASNPQLKAVFPDIRQQLGEQLKCLDVRLENQVSLVAEIQEYFRRRAEVELEYSRSLDKLARNLIARHRAEKQKREQWPQFSTYSCWQQLISTTKRQSREHAVLSELYANNMIQRFTQVIEDIQRIFKTCRDIGFEGHEELLKVLHELHTAMKTYHTYHAEMKQAESKLQYVEAQRTKLELSIPKEKLEKSKKFKLIEKEIQKRQSKFNDANVKAIKARNEYIFCLDVANAAIHKYFMDDLSDLIDCMDFGFHNCIARALMLYLSAEDCMRKSCQQGIDSMNKCISSLDSRLDKQRFLEYNNNSFMMPKKFEFQSHKGDEVTTVLAEQSIQEEVETRYRQLNRRLGGVRTENEEIWKTLVTAEKSLLEMINIKDYDCSRQFFDDECSEKVANNVAAANSKPPESAMLKLRADRQETEDFYLSKFREYTLGSNLIARLQSKYDAMSKSVSRECVEMTSSQQLTEIALPPKPRRKRIGRTPMLGQPKLFGGSLEEYLEAVNQEIPLVLKSCIRVINLYGLHHQGVFRVSGSQVEINNFRDAFERGEDPLADMMDASDMNSVAGVMKLYLRELREPLFPIYYFEQLMQVSQLESKHEFVNKVRDVVISLPRPVFLVMRYLFAFLNHLSEFSDENMMDPYNLAICFGPTLLPIPEDKDQVQYQNLVNELVKNIIIYQEDIFPDDGGIVYEKYISNNVPDENDVGEAPADQASEDSEGGCGQSEDDSVFKDKEITEQIFGKAEVLEAVAQFDFTARSHRELSFRKGDNITLYSQVSSDWWKGSLDGVHGLVPDKYIMLRIRDEEKEKGSSDENVRRRTSSSSDSAGGGSSGGVIGCHSPRPVARIAEEGDVLPGPGEVEPDPISPSIQLEELPRIRHRSRSPATTPTTLYPTPLARSREYRRLVSSDGAASVSVQTERRPTSSDGVEVVSRELQRDLDSALAHVISTIEHLEKKAPLRTKDAPDLVMDLPLNPSSPTTSTRESPQTPAPPSEVNAQPVKRDLTAAERFALSNQCTVRKGGAQGGVVMGLARSATTNMVGLLGSYSTDAQTQTVRTIKRSTSTTLVQDNPPPIPSKLQPKSPQPPVNSSGKELLEGPRSVIAKPWLDYDIGTPVDDPDSTGAVSLFKPVVKVKPPVMKKPQLPNIPSPEPTRKLSVGDRELKQTSC